MSQGRLSTKLHAHFDELLRQGGQFFLLALFILLPTAQSCFLKLQSRFVQTDFFLQFAILLTQGWVCLKWRASTRTRLLTGTLTL